MPHAAPRPGSARSSATPVATASGASATSESTKNSISPLAHPAPVFLATAGPLLTGVRMTVTPMDSAMRTDSSVLWSSTMTISRGA